LALNGSSNRFILVVDDEHDILDVIQFCLRMYDFKACTFIDPLAALEHFNSNFKAHDIVISDIRMPGMNGYEFVKQIKKINPKVKLVLMTAFEIANKEFSNILPDVKIDAFIKKPFSLMTLSNIVKKQYKQTTKLV
jgi:DNA-binding NtrC family response regulator